MYLLVVNRIVFTRGEPDDSCSWAGTTSSPREQRICRRRLGKSGSRNCTLLTLSSHNHSSLRFRLLALRGLLGGGNDVCCCCNLVVPSLSVAQLTAADAVWEERSLSANLSSLLLRESCQPSSDSSGAGTEGSTPPPAAATPPVPANRSLLGSLSRLGRAGELSVALIACSSCEGSS